METKVCSKCGTEKPLSEYHKHKACVGGVNSYCKFCQYEQNKKWAEANKEKDKRSKQNSRLKLRFGITVEDYDKLLDSQNGVCAICGQPETKTHNGTDTVIALAVDHCHTDGHIRGLLCKRCNQTLGQVEDNIDILENMITYLKRSI